MTPKASFVIPAFNADRWISRAIGSCRTQSVNQVEIIIVNDGSTDETRDIIEHHATEDKRVRIFNQDNQGRSAARNFGNEVAQSEIIMVLDADDMATRNRTKDTLDAFRLKKADLVFGSFFLIDSMGSAERKVVSSPFDPEIAEQKKLNFICHSTMAYTKKLTKSVRYEDGMYTKLGLDDWKFQWDAYKKGFKIKNIRNPLCYYRITEDGTMATRDVKEVEKVKETYFAKA